jgi:hypothetical protein
LEHGGKRERHFWTSQLRAWNFARRVSPRIFGANCLELPKLKAQSD